MQNSIVIILACVNAKAIFVLEQAVGPGVLQTFSTCSVKQ